MSLAKTQKRGHGSHSHGHGHGHHHDNTYLTSKNKHDAGVRITRVGLYVNVVMAVGKAVGGYLLNSQSLLADAFHSLTDLVSDILTLSTVSYSLKPSSERFPTGYGKIESLGSLGVSSLLLFGGLGLGWHSLELLSFIYWHDSATVVHDHAHNAHEHASGLGGIFGHSHSHNPADMGIPSIHAAWIAAGSIAVKEYLYQKTMRIATERKSSILASNAVHHRIDSLTSIVALAAILGSNMFHNVAWLDPVGGLLVSLMVVRAGWANTGSALLELADVSIDHETKSNMHRALKEILQSDDIFNLTHTWESRPVISGLEGSKAGQSYMVHINFEVPGTVRISETNAFEQFIRQELAKKIRGLRLIRMRFTPPSEHQNTSDLDAASLDAGSEPNSHEQEHVHDDRPARRRPNESGI